MKLILRVALLTIVALPVFAQHLPTGTYRPNRERSYDIIHYKADLTVDWARKRISGEATIQMRSLYPRASVALDAYRLDVKRVRESPSNRILKHSAGESTLEIEFGRTLSDKDTTTIIVEYSATPTAGLYFVETPSGERRVPSIFTYGEGGIHANWLPVYNDVNDKFSSEMVVTVQQNYVAISNGKLLSTTRTPDGKKRFHWSQSLPHSTYLIALFVGEYVPVELRSAFGSIPLTAWTPAGTKREAEHVFGRTTDMVEYFSDRFAYRYPWEKYDQVAAFDYAVGAMENTSITGHNDRILRKPGQYDSFGPDFDYFTTNWTDEALVSHELAHHWFGDNVTCRSLASIWLNESFASYLMMLWDEHRLGKEYFQSQTWLALQHYLKYVRMERIIRPLEYRFFDTRSEIYNEQTTYLKGAIVLNMLRWILGDEDFFNSLGYYLRKHEFSNVEAHDLKIAIEEATGRNLHWFFEQWVHGGGHPVFEVHTHYLVDRKKLEVVISQVQPLVEGQGIFELPVEVRIDSRGKTARHTVWIRNKTEVRYFDSDAEPSLVSFDGQGNIVRDLIFEKSAKELMYQIQNDDLPGQLWALHQLVTRFAEQPVTLQALRSVTEGNAHWSLKAEATLMLRHIPTSEAESMALQQLGSTDPHVRKAAVLALGSKPTPESQRALRRIADEDPVDDIGATAIVSLARINSPLTIDDLRAYLQKQSWYDVKRLAVLKAVEIMGSPVFLPLVQPNISGRYNYAIRRQALSTWAAVSPTDQKLIDALIMSAKNDILPVRRTAMSILGKLKIERAVATLEEIRTTDGDSDIRKFADDALEEIKRVR